VSGFGDCPQPAARVKPEKKFFIFFRCNPLKSPIRPKESKEMQGFFLGFPWIHLDFLGANSRAG
jgi:hypothetical protein